MLVVILKVGLPTVIQMVVVNISYLMITGMLNHFGVAVAAASGVGLKVNTFAGMHCWAIGAGRYSYGWAEYGRKSYRTRQKDNRNRTVLQYYDYTDRNPICSNICQTSHYAV